MNFRDQVYEVVRCVPRGQVVTYGQVASLCGYPGRARHVGHALAGCGEPDVPWFRVLNAAGRISLPGEERQRAQAELLRAEGVEVRDLRVRLAQFRWEPSPLAFAR